MGERFGGRYELVDCIGQGGMGSVWRVWDLRDGCYRAAKMLHSSDATSLLRFVRELGYRISHPHVVAPLGWVGEDDRVLFTMELVDGGSVATLLGDYGRLPPDWTAVLLDQLLSALEAVHAAGIVHRDVKPGNLLLRATGRERPHVLLGDFGIAAPVAGPRLTSQSIVLGTLGYLAPEQLRGAAPEARQDLFAAGAVAAELLTGRRDALFGGETPDNAVSGVPDGVPATLWSIVRGLAAQAPEDRYPSATAARAALAASGCVPAVGEPLDDDGLEIEVLQQVAPLPPREDRHAVRTADAPAADPGPPDPVAALRSPAAADTAATASLPTEVHSTQPPDDGAPRGGPGLLALFLAVALLGALLLVVGVVRAMDGPGAPDDSGTPGTLEVRDSCDFTEVGSEGRATDGARLVCTRYAPNAYRWEPAP